MSRFVEVEANLINVDHIVRVRQHKNYALSIYLDNGNVIKTDYACERVLEDIMGRDFIEGTVACEGVSVAIDNGEGTRFYPVRHLALTGDGEVRPLSVQFDRVEFFDDWDGYGGMTHTRPPRQRKQALDGRLRPQRFPADDQNERGTYLALTRTVSAVSF